MLGDIIFILFFLRCFFGLLFVIFFASLFALFKAFFAAFSLLKLFKIADTFSGVSPVLNFNGSSKTFSSQRSSIEPTAHLFLLRSLGGSSFNERLCGTLSMLSLFSSLDSSSGSPGLVKVVLSLAPQGSSLIFTRVDLLLAVSVLVVSIAA